MTIAKHLQLIKYNQRLNLFKKILFKAQFNKLAERVYSIYLDMTLV